MTCKFWVSSVATLTVLITPMASEAVSFSLSSFGGGSWIYTLTYDPLDNYSIFQPTTTITLSGLSGVSGALGPTSTDFEPPGGFFGCQQLGVGSHRARRGDSRELDSRWSGDRKFWRRETCVWVHNHRSWSSDWPRQPRNRRLLARYNERPSGRHIRARYFDASLGTSRSRSSGTDDYAFDWLRSLGRAAIPDTIENLQALSGQLVSVTNPGQSGAVAARSGCLGRGKCLGK